MNELWRCATICWPKDIKIVLGMSKVMIDVLIGKNHFKASGVQESYVTANLICIKNLKIRQIVGKTEKN